VSVAEPSNDRLQAIAVGMRAGDPAAFEAFLDGLWHPIVRYVTRIVGSVDDAEDVAQEAFARVWEQRAGLRLSSSIRAYVYQIARNLALNEAKRHESRARMVTRLSTETPFTSATPAGELDRAEVREVVRAAIDALPARRREAFVLAHLHGLPYREVADVMEISPQSVANQISAALADLRLSLGPYVRGAASIEHLQLG
jgi:RNA polymerase sigma-70 factor (ECF subfamily)